MFNVFIIIVDWLCLALRDTCSLRDLQNTSDPSYSACRHTPDPGGTDRLSTQISPHQTFISPRRKCLLCGCRRHWKIFQRLQTVRAKGSFKLCNFNFTFILTKLFRPMDGCISSLWWLSPLHIISPNFWNLRQFMEESIPTILAGINY